MHTTTKPLYIWLTIAICGLFSIISSWTLFGWAARGGPFYYNGPRSDFLIFSFFVLLVRALEYGLCAFFLYKNKRWVRWLFLTHIVFSIFVVSIGTWIYNAYLLLGAVVDFFRVVGAIVGDVILRWYIIHLFLSILFTTGVFHYFRRTQS